MRIPTVLALLVGLIGGCSSQSGPDNTNMTELPPFTSIRTDLIDGDEGVSKPLQVAPCIYPLAESIVGQYLTCNSPPVLFAKSNSIAGPAYDVWRLAINNEPAWMADSGVPNQSMPLDGKPFSVDISRDSVVLRLVGINDNRIPYLGVAYIRGVQGDATPNISKWGSHSVLEFNIDYGGDRPDNQWFMVWLFFRKDGQNRMYRYEFKVPDNDKTPYSIHWNWPAINSYYYPGAKLYRPVQPTVPPGKVVIDVEAFAESMSPEFIGSDFLGAEWAIEQAPGPGTMWMRLSGVRMHRRP